MSQEIVVLHIGIFSLTFTLLGMFLVSVLLKKRAKRQAQILIEEKKIQNIGDIFVKVFSASPIPTILIGKDDHKIYKANESFLNTTGTKSSNILEKRLQDLHFFELDMSGLDGRVEIETSLLTKTKKRLWFNILITEITIMNSDYYILVFHDITERKRILEVDQKLKLLYETIAKASFQKQNMENFCRLVLPKLVEIFDLESGLIRLHVNSEKKLKLVATHNLEPDVVRSFGEYQDLEDTDFISLESIKDKRSIILSDIKKIDKYEQHKEKLEPLNIKSFVSYPLLGINGNLIGIIHLWSQEIVDDIEEKKYLFERLLELFIGGIQSTYALQRIEESEERYRHLYETATVGLFRTEIGTGRLIEINDYGAKLIGFANKEEVQKGNVITTDYYVEDERKTIYHALRSKGEINDYELIWKHDKDNYSYFLTSMKFHPKKGFIEGSFLDITDRKLVEDALMYGEERFRNVISSSPYGIHIFEIGKDSIVLSDANLASYGILGNHLESSIGLDVSQVSPYKNNNKTLAAFDSVMKTFESWSGEVKIASSGNKSGKGFRTLDFRIFKAAGDSIVAMFSDITDRRALELERAKMRRSLEQKNHELEQLLFVTSHDLRSPLVNILGFSGELEEDLLELAKKVDQTEDIGELKATIEELIGTRLFESSQFIQKSAKKIDRLLRGLLKLSRIGRLPINHERIDTSQMIRDILDTMRFQIQKEQISIDYDNLPYCIGDHGQLNQVFSNLIDNAIKYMKKSGQKIIKIYGNSTENSVTYTIEDNGIGIRKEHQDKIFQIFHRLNPSKGTGFGLGMTIVQRIVSKHGGDVWVESEENVGTKVHVKLPYDESILGESHE